MQAGHRSRQAEGGGDVVLGRGWLDACHASSQQRLDDTSDWVRLEVETAPPTTARDPRSRAGAAMQASGRCRSRWRDSTSTARNDRMPLATSSSLRLAKTLDGPLAHTSSYGAPANRIDCRSPGTLRPLPLSARSWPSKAAGVISPCAAVRADEASDATAHRWRIRRWRKPTSCLAPGTVSPLRIRLTAIRGAVTNRILRYHGLTRSTPALDAIVVWPAPSTRRTSTNG